MSERATLCRFAYRMIDPDSSRSLTPQTVASCFGISNDNMFAFKRGNHARDSILMNTQSRQICVTPSSGRPSDKQPRIENARFPDSTPNFRGNLLLQRYVGSPERVLRRKQQ